MFGNTYIHIMCVRVAWLNTRMTQPIGMKPSILNIKQADYCTITLYIHILKNISEYWIHTICFVFSLNREGRHYESEVEGPFNSGVTCMYLLVSWPASDSAQDFHARNLSNFRNFSTIICMWCDTHVNLRFESLYLLLKTVLI